MYQDLQDITGLFETMVVTSDSPNSPDSTHFAGIDWKVENRRDHAIQHVIWSLQNSLAPDIDVHSEIKCFLKERGRLLSVDGVLYRKRLAQKEEQMQLVLPQVFHK